MSLQPSEMSRLSPPLQRFHLGSVLGHPAEWRVNMVILVELSSLAMPASSSFPQFSCKTAFRGATKRATDGLLAPSAALFYFTQTMVINY
jgi:hypothetical protein